MKRWALRLGLGWITWRLLGPEPVPSFEVGQTHPLRIGGRSVFVGDLELFVREAGDPEATPIVLVHGWGDHTEVVWHRLIPLLGARHRVVAIDLRNHGRSASGRGPFQVSELADDVAGVMDQVNVGSCAVFGFSLGGMVAQELAHRYPARVRALILGGTSAGGLGAAHKFLLSAVWLGGRALDRVSRVELTRAKYVYLINRGVVPASHGRWLWNELMSRDTDLYWQAGFAGLRFDSTGWVGRLDVPTLVIIPTDDQLILPSSQYDLAGRLGDPELVELAGARHEAPITHAGEIADSIEAFLEKVSTDD